MPDTIIRRFNVYTKLVKDQLERLNALADPGFVWIEGREGIEREKTQLVLVARPPTKGKK